MNLGIYIYDHAEVLDFSGPFEVFCTARRLAGADWNIFLVSENGGMVTARGNFPVQAHYAISDHPPIDVLIIAGGVHTEEIKKRQVTDWVSKISASAKKVASVCTGCFILAQTGLLDGRPVTTHWEDIPDLKALYPELIILENRRWVKDGKYVTSGGISAGIDMSLFLVSELVSGELADKTARQMEYRWEKSQF